MPHRGTSDATVDGPNELPDTAERTGSEPSSAFSSLSIDSYRMLWWAGTFSFMAVQMQFLLRGILAWDLTEREGALGLVYLCFGVSMLIATPLGGVAADRLPNRKVLVGSQIVLVAGATGMGIVVVADVAQLWMLLIAAVATGSAFGFYGPARIAFAAKLVGRDQIGNAITLSMLSLNGTRVFAPAFAGMLAGVAFFGIGGAYLVSASFSIVSLIFLMRCPEGEVKVATSTSGPFTEIANGIRYVRADPPLRRLVVSSFFVIMFGFNYVAFIPALVKDVFDLTDGYVGILMSGSAIGAIAVSVGLARHADGPSARRLMIISGVCFGASVVALSAAPVFATAVLAVAFVGAGAAGYQSLSNTIALSMAEDSHQGRVQSLLMLSFAGFGIAALPLGLLAESIGLRYAMALMGIVAVGASGAYVFFDRVHGDERLVDPAVDAAGPIVAG
jgi:predicted MFS family arabinose efflux permease